MADHGYHAKVIRLGVPDLFIEQGTVAELHQVCGIDAAGILKTIFKQVPVPVV
jgi:1-deoxy-D-xylulose-5-phosphate synthase